MYPKQQSFLVYGLSRSGTAAANFLLKKNAVVYIYDDIQSARVEKEAKALEDLGAKRLSKETLGKAAESCDVLVLSPGIPIDHPLAVAFKKAGKNVVGESELAARYLQGNILAVTGTNGKTTTVSMLAQVLQKGGMDAQACGNIGMPMLSLYPMKEEQVAVAEISSFQMETLNSLRPHIAMILNITEDHLNRHYNMENYVFLKRKLLKNLTETEFAILNYDDPIVRSFAEKTRAKVLYFSVREKVNGSYYDNGDLYFGKEKILSVSDLPTGGIHNVQNALATITAAKLMGINSRDIAAALSDFKGIKHRVEFVLEAKGVRYVDDSKGTNVDATLKAVAAVDTEIVLLLGGKDKGYDYDKLFNGLKGGKVVHAILYGENRFKLLESARRKGFLSVTVCDAFAFAVQIACLKATCGQTVLLSPASASFDEFANYEERGEKFVEIIRAFSQEEKAKTGESGACGASERDVESNANDGMESEAVKTD
jgi:UDP-N-acetylmuramoylalanine--D-glutamate ligase